MNPLKKFTELSELNDWLLDKGYAMNQSGGLIKGTQESLLEQSSTMAAKIQVQFTEGPMEIPGCYMEFAKRYPSQDGKMFQGFIAKSADKIFESTNTL